MCNNSEKVTPESLSSIELTRNAKLGTQIKVKIYDLNPEEAKKKALALYDELCNTYSS